MRWSLWHQIYNLLTLFWVQTETNVSALLYLYSISSLLFVCLCKKSIFKCQNDPILNKSNSILQYLLLWWMICRLSITFDQFHYKSTFLSFSLLNEIHHIHLIVTNYSNWTKENKQKDFIPIMITTLIYNKNKR